MPKSYVISVDSDTYYSGTITDRVYYMDWSKLPRGRYSVDWTFQSATIAGLDTLLATGPICLHLDAFQGAYQFQARSEDCPTHAVFGSLEANFFTATAGIMTTDVKTNSVITLDTLPSYNRFLVKLRYGMSEVAPASFSRYFLSFEFTLIDEGEDNQYH